MEVDEPLRVQAAEAEDVFGCDFTAAVERAPRRELVIPFEQVAIEIAVDFAILAPRDGRGERPAVRHTVEFDRGGEARHVVGIEKFRLMEPRPRYLGAPSAAPPAGADRPRVQARLIDVQ